MKLFKKLFCNHVYHTVKRVEKLEQTPCYTSTITHRTILTSTCLYCGKVKTEEMF